MAFDYCTAVEAFNYGGSAGEGTDPVNELAEMGSIVTSVSRAIDAFCLQAFSQTTFTDLRARGKIDRDGVLTIALPSPTISTVTAVSYQIGASLTWEAADLAGLDTDQQDYGSTIRLLNAGLLASRGRRVTAKVTYTGGWASRDAMPADLRLAARAAAWYEYQRRSAPQDTTAMPSLGVVVVPGDWPPHIKAKLAPYVRVVAL